MDVIFWLFPTNSHFKKMTLDFFMPFHLKPSHFFPKAPWFFKSL